VRTRKNVKKNLVAKRGRLSLALMRLKGFLLVAVPILCVVGAGYLLSAAARSAFVVKEVVFSGNVHLSDDELRTLAGIRGGESLLTLSSADVYGKISATPWIRSVVVRKEFPGRLLVRVKETEPFALLDMKGRLFIVDERGKMLEELRESSMPFLPIISGDPFGNKEVFSDAIRLVRAVKETGLMARKNRIEIIAHRLNDIAVNLDGVVIKVGAGDYEEKLSRLTELEEEINARHIPVDYIDLRFANRVVVKPVNEVVK
jgi:cell division protein FtsQ